MLVNILSASQLSSTHLHWLPFNMLSSSHCKRCSTVATAPQGPGWLHLHFANPYSFGKLLLFLREVKWQFSYQGNTLKIFLPDEALLQFFSPLVEILTPMERSETKALFQPQEKVLELADYFEIDSLRRLYANLQSPWLAEVIAQNQLYSEFQPIVEAQTSQVFAYECLLRGQQNGQRILPGRLLEVARETGNIFQLDVAARLAAIQGAAQHQIQEKIFINFTPSAIYEPSHCLKTTIRELDRLGLQRHQIVFEVIESEQITDITHLCTILDYYRREGFEVALDDLGSGYSSLNLLHELRPDYVKLDMGLVRDVDQNEYKGLIAQKLLEVAHLLEIKTIAEGIETEGEALWLQQHDADYMQGYYFARPAVPPPLRSLIPQE